MPHGLKQKIACLGNASSNNYDLRVKNVDQPSNRYSNWQAKCIKCDYKGKIEEEKAKEAVS